MSVPQGFYELQPPALVDQYGKALSAPNAEQAWDWPIFIRAVVVPIHGGGSPFPEQHLRKFPGWRLYGGPMARWHFFEAKKFLEQWAFAAGHFLHAEMVPILPNQPPTLWPHTDFRWSWQYEAMPPRRWRVAYSGLGGAKPILA